MLSGVSSWEATMQDTKKPEKYALLQPISDRIIDNQEVMTVIRESTVIRWHEIIAAEGWNVVAEPVVRSEANIGYGWPLYDGDEPILGDDGEQLTDHTKEILSVIGWVTR